jgi:hypothetical protein
VDKDQGFIEGSNGTVISIVGEVDRRERPNKHAPSLGRVIRSFDVPKANTKKLRRQMSEAFDDAEFVECVTMNRFRPLTRVLVGTAIG